MQAGPYGNKLVHYMFTEEECKLKAYHIGTQYLKLKSRCFKLSSSGICIVGQLIASKIES